MDKFILATILVLALVEVLCVVSLFSSDWINSNMIGNIRHGLYLSCHSLPNQDEECNLQSQHFSWTAVAFVIVLSVGVTAVSMILMAVHLKNNTESYATVGKWVALIGLMLLCVAGILFPIGFAAPEFGAQSYHLLSPFQSGYSYILFNIAIVLDAAALVVANKFFWPFCAQFFNANR